MLLTLFLLELRILPRWTHRAGTSPWDVDIKSALGRKIKLLAVAGIVVGRVLHQPLQKVCTREAEQT